MSRFHLALEPDRSLCTIACLASQPAPTASPQARPTGDVQASQRQDERRAESAGLGRRGDGQAGACCGPEIPAVKIKIPCNLKTSEIPFPISTVGRAKEYIS